MILSDRATHLLLIDCPQDVSDWLLPRSNPGHYRKEVEMASNLSLHSPIIDPVGKAVTATLPRNSSNSFVESPTERGESRTQPTQLRTRSN